MLKRHIYVSERLQKWCENVLRRRRRFCIYSLALKKQKPLGAHVLPTVPFFLSSFFLSFFLSCQGIDADSDVHNDRRYVRKRIRKEWKRIPAAAGHLLLQLAKRPAAKGHVTFNNELWVRVNDAKTTDYVRIMVHTVKMMPTMK